MELLDADTGTWNAITEAEDRQDPERLGELAEDLYASLGEAQDSVIRLKAELHVQACRREAVRAPGRPDADDEVVPPGRPARLGRGDQLGQ
jgi:hypothetical protein